ncbi:MAG: TerB family tellurite resistance protein [Pseudomonadota bacterium]
MFEGLKTLVIHGESGDNSVWKSAFDPADARMAVAALLVMMIRVDQRVTAEEEACIRAALDREFSVSGKDLEGLINEATERSHEAVDLNDFTARLRYAMTDAQLLDVVEMLWEAIHADGLVHELEDTMMWRVAELLGISVAERTELGEKVARRSLKRRL